MAPDRVHITGRQEQGSRRTRRRMKRYRTGAEGRISHLKRGYGLRRTHLKGDEGHQTWNGWATFTYRYRGESCVLRTTALPRSLELRARVLPGLARTGD